MPYRVEFASIGEPLPVDEVARIHRQLASGISMRDGEVGFLSEVPVDSKQAQAAGFFPGYAHPERGPLVGFRVLQRLATRRADWAAVDLNDVPPEIMSNCRMATQVHQLGDGKSRQQIVS